MQLCIQDPSYSKSMYLHESILMACKDGVLGGGAYAFASQGGVELLFADEAFNKFMNAGSFYLIVGMDDITNIKTLKALQNYIEQYKGHLIVKAYVHNSRGSTFHPKYCWFKKKDGGMLVIGSGNLTQQGLRHNREAYTVVECDQKTIEGIVEEWNSWIAHSQAFLFGVDDSLVLNIAAKNTTKTNAIAKAKQEIADKPESPEEAALKDLFRSQPKNLREKGETEAQKQIAPHKENDKKTSIILPPPEEYDEDDAYWILDQNNEVLVAEIPKSGNRWKQVNFSKEIFENFFGATCGENGVYRVLLKSINSRGIMGETEIRPSVSVSSHNYRFELNAATGINYPEDGKRPIGVFAKVSERDFLYELIMPGDEGYDSLITAINSRQPMTTRMRRLIYRCEEIIQETPELSIWKRIGGDCYDEK